MKYKYRGLFGRKASRRCPHSRLQGIYGDAIIYAKGYRIWCMDCGRSLDGPASLAEKRASEI